MPTTTVQFKSLWAQFADASRNTPVDLYLLKSTMTSLPPDLGASSGPVLELQLLSYSALDSRISAGSWPMKTDGSSMMELSLPTTGDTWTATGTFTVNFRWLAIVAKGYLLSVIDYGSGISLTNSPISITAAESTYIDGSHPVYRWRVQ